MCCCVVRTAPRLSEWSVSADDQLHLLSLDVCVDLWSSRPTDPHTIIINQVFTIIVIDGKHN